METRVELRVAADFIEDFDREARHLLPGREVARRPDDDVLVLTWLAPDAPEGAALMEPFFVNYVNAEGAALAGISWYDADGRPIRPPAA
ncbi:hypothetical protein [Streptomyces sp. DT18]